MDELIKALFGQSPSLAILAWFAWQSWRERAKLQETVTNLIREMVTATTNTSAALHRVEAVVIETRRIVGGCHGARDHEAALAATKRMNPIHH
jgi:hypothetical protein